MQRLRRAPTVIGEPLAFNALGAHAIHLPRFAHQATRSSTLGFLALVVSHLLTPRVLTPRVVVLGPGEDRLIARAECRRRQLRADAEAVDGRYLGGDTRRAEAFCLHGHLSFTLPALGAMALFSSRPRPPAAPAVIFLGTTILAVFISNSCADFRSHTTTTVRFPTSHWTKSVVAPPMGIQPK